MSGAATIRVSREVKRLLDGLKVHPREPYSAVIGRVVCRAYDPEPLSAEEIAGLEEALEEKKAGRIHSEAEVMAVLRIE